MNALKAVMIKLMLRVCSFLPLSVARAMGRLGVHLYWPLGGRSRRVTQRNIELVFPELSPDERHRLAKRSLLATGELMAEMGHVWLRPFSHVQGLCKEIHGAEPILEAQKQGRGVIILGPHLGNWEVVGLHMASLGSSVVLFEPPKIAALGPIMQHSRERTGIRVVPTDSRGIVQLLKSVKGGNISGILPDQAPSDLASGQNSPFMGQMAFTPTLACNMLRRTGALAMFGFAERVPGGFILRYLPAEDAIYDADTAVSLAAMNRGVEACARMCVEQYQWEYKRFRVRPKNGPGVYDDL
jgi:Kdo2-lipid IVA lauroyltransferase/acyltransferase